MEKNRELLYLYIMRRLKEGESESKENIYKNNEKLKTRTPFLSIKKHINDFLNNKIENRYIIMPGLRGLGKTTLIYQLYDYLLNEKNIDSDRILYLSGDQLNGLLNESILSAVNVFIEDVHKKTPIRLDKEIFIFIDEAQYDEKWSLAGKILYDQSKKIFMVFTGSSALDFEINVDAARRTKKETIFPMNFQEFLLLKHKSYFPKNTSNLIKNTILTGNIQELLSIENEIIKELFNIKILFQKEFEQYLRCGGFPENIYLSPSDSHERTYNMIERVIEKDVMHYKSIGKKSKSIIIQMLTFLALQKPGELSKKKLASKLGVSSSIIQENLNILEKTQLIFHIKGYGSAGKIIRKPWKYYFLSSSLKASFNFNLGKYAPENREFLGILAENSVASHFYKMKKIDHKPYGIFYPPEPGHADFILSKINEDLIPVEVGIGKKNKNQIKKSMNKYNSPYGIIISGTSMRIKKEEDIIYLPLTIFSLC